MSTAVVEHDEEECASKTSSSFVTSVQCITYPSQLEYGKYGARICTPVASVVASRFLIVKTNSAQSDVLAFPSVEKLFSEQRVRDIMIASHRLYEERFSFMNSNLMLLDIQQFFPSCIYTVEVAGTLHSTVDSHQRFLTYSASNQDGMCLASLFRELDKSQQEALFKCGDVQVIDKKLVIMPLNELIAYLFDLIRCPADDAPQRISLLVTANAHTVCYLFDSARTSKDFKDTIYLFDSLKASLTKVTSIYNCGDADTVHPQSKTLENVEYSGLVAFHEKDYDFFLGMSFVYK